MMFWYGGGWAFWQVALMVVGMVVFWALVIWAVYALVAGTGRWTGTGHGGGGPRQILDERLARGEIDADEYRRLRDLLATGSTREPGSAGSLR